MKKSVKEIQRENGINPVLNSSGRLSYLDNAKG